MELFVLIKPIFQIISLYSLFCFLLEHYIYKNEKSQNHQVPFAKKRTNQRWLETESPVIFAQILWI